MSSPIPDPEVIVVKTPGPTTVTTVNVPGQQGANYTYVGPTNKLSTTPGSGGLWIQTGLGADGKGITFWVEDGT